MMKKVRCIPRYFLREDLTRRRRLKDRKEFLNSNVKLSQSNASRTYLVIGAVSLFFMALLWSVDDSIIYIFLGLAAACFYLAYNSRPETQESFKRASSSAKEEPTFESFFRTKTQKATTTVAPERTKAIMAFVFIGGMILFFSIVMSLVFSDDDSITSLNFDRAESFRLNQQNDSAKIYYRKDLNDDPIHREAFMGLGNIFITEENYDSARHYFRKAVEIDPDDEEARYNIALTYYYQKDYQTSLRETLRLVKENPNNSDAVLLTGDNYSFQNRYDSALFYYQTEYDRGTKTPGLSHAIAYIYDTKGQRDKAIPMYKEALSMDSTRVEIYDRMAELDRANATFYQMQAKKWRDAGYN